MKKNNNDYLISSGNLFADIGVLNSAERFAKTSLALQINNVIKQKNLTQAEAAKLFAIDQSKILALSTGRLSGFSLERLFRFLNVLDHDITIKIVPKAKTKKKADLTICLPKIKELRITKNSATSPGAMPVHAHKKK